MPHDRRQATTQETLAVVKRMEAALAANSDDMATHFHERFRWMGNAGCGTKNGLDEFRRNWQLPLRAAFTGREYKTEQFVAEGEWASCFGHIEATHSGEFMGIPPTGKQATVSGIDMIRIRDGKVVEHWVQMDQVGLMQQLGLMPSP